MAATWEGHHRGQCRGAMGCTDGVSQTLWHGVWDIYCSIYDGQSGLAGWLVWLISIRCVDVCTAAHIQI